MMSFNIAPRSQGGLSKELSEPERMSQWSRQQQRGLESLSAKAALLKEGFMLPSPLRHDANPAFQKES